MLPLEGKRIVLGVTGGIAAYKAIEVCRRLSDLGAHVVPVMTESAMKMVGRATFDALASEPVKTSIFGDSDPIPHTHLGQDADLILVCPATARIISDLTTGRSADLLSATLIATDSPVVVAPAMHTEMWEHPAVSANMATLVDRGVVVVAPEQGRLAGGDVGKGRLAKPETIVADVVATLKPNDLMGRTVLVSAGGTREALDPVRFVTNHSSGKQGHAIAEECRSRGAKTILVTTSTLWTHPDIDLVAVATAAEMKAAIDSESDQCDSIVMTAAVADFRPVDVSATKIKKGDGPMLLELERTDDILAGLGERKPQGQILIGFAAETNDLLANAESKMSRKNLDLIVANDVSAEGVGFAGDTNRVSILGSDGFRLDVPLASKASIAASVVDQMSELLKSSEPLNRDEQT